MVHYLRCALALPLHLVFQLLDQTCYRLRRYLRLDVYWLLFPEWQWFHDLATWAARIVRGTGATSAP